MTPPPDGSSPDVEVRRLDAGAAGIAASLYAASTEGARVSMERSAMRAFLEDPTVWFFAAFERGRPSGFLYGYLLRRPDAPRPRFVAYELEVAPTARRRGVATALLNAARTAMVPLQARVWMLAEPDNAAAVGFCESQGGFRPAGRSAVFTFPRS